MKIRVNLCDLALLLDLPDGMSIESAETEDLTLVCEVESLEFEDGVYFAHYDVDEDGNVALTELSPL